MSIFFEFLLISITTSTCIEETVFQWGLRIHGLLLHHIMSWDFPGRCRLIWWWTTRLQIAGTFRSRSSQGLPCWLPSRSRRGWIWRELRAKKLAPEGGRRISDVHQVSILRKYSWLRILNKMAKTCEVIKIRSCAHRGETKSEITIVVRSVAVDTNFHSVVGVISAISLTSLRESQIVYAFARQDQVWRHLLFDSIKKIVHF